MGFMNKARITPCTKTSINIATWKLERDEKDSEGSAGGSQLYYV